MRVDGIKTHDVAGIGFGPSNLSLAIALDELDTASDRPAVDAAFFEKQAALGWHRGMLLPGANMQISFLKDLVTFRNPASPYSFVSYLHTVGRLAAFANRTEFFPSRREFHDYLEWVEAQFTKYVTYSSEVVSVQPVRSENGFLDKLQLEVREGATGATRTVHARNVVVSTGLVPKMPEGFERGEGVWHSSEFLTRFQVADPERLRSVAVLGAGQSAAEVVRHLYDNLPDADVYAILSPVGYSIADATPLANQVFDPDAVDDYYFSSEEAKDAVWRYHKNTNYSVVDDELIRDLYERRYADEVVRRNRLRFLNLSRALTVENHGPRTRVAVQSLRTGETDQLDVDLLVCATGYLPVDPTTLLGEAAGLCLRDERGRVRVERDYRLVTDPELKARIYLQGGTEHTHGLSAALLSNMAARNGEIANSIVQGLAGPASDTDGKAAL
ncbi:lysine N(6)-hydroxylase/L-ornithine N(5)-oxygenase family protein [Kitasatospora sp. NBC_00315]|uniref:lysine N(6)-hydroxylase/L-ornithine N(5)-oxygenase family protein n=1 Tax=Kitasatospora sp. NBC_00315 TaxID=2975963 RepID=UPI003252672B